MEGKLGIIKRVKGEDVNKYRDMVDKEELMAVLRRVCKHSTEKFSQQQSTW